ncbi:hypothetical protein SBRY_20126 [Actinacidiphila bryophytorum]|uniref:Uncharacterized protein n=1 Tax=Actinacidiphila bryophytorum TaxID=1436133 RepID=A0A9W4E936_9ACTN|nr:hypothetical protein SBRY_20126 [Actinacidiphila bryophytorum]
MPPVHGHCRLQYSFRATLAPGPSQQERFLRALPHYKPQAGASVQEVIKSQLRTRSGNEMDFTS